VGWNGYGVCSNLASSGEPPPPASQSHFNHCWKSISGIGYARFAHCSTFQTPKPGFTPCLQLIPGLWSWQLSNLPWFSGSGKPRLVILSPCNITLYRFNQRGSYYCRGLKCQRSFCDRLFCYAYRCCCHAVFHSGLRFAGCKPLFHGKVSLFTPCMCSFFFLCVFYCMFLLYAAIWHIK